MTTKELRAEQDREKYRNEPGTKTPPEAFTIA